MAYNLVVKNAERQRREHYLADAISVDNALARLDVSQYGSHSLRRTRIALIYKKTGNLKVAQVLLGHKSIQHTQNYLGVEEYQALEIAQQYEGYFR